MPRPGELTRGRANRKVKTPGGRLNVHRQKFYRTRGTCAVSGASLQLPRNAREERNRNSSHSSKRPNRPYGGKVGSSATRRAIIRKAREIHQ